MKRRTKIICTIGPATASFDGLKALYEAGMNIVRLNMSHSDHASALKIINWIKTLNRQVDYPIPILLDTQGPEIRTGVLDNPMELNPGDVVTLSVRDGELVEQRSIHVNYTELVDVVEVGRVITVDNGLMNFKVLQKKDHQLTCEVIDGGTLGSRKHVNLPGVRVNLPAITAKDRADIAFGMANDVDFIALSFVRSPDDIKELREFLGKKQQSIKVVAKIEDQEGVNKIHEIFAVSDGVMVARGDLGMKPTSPTYPTSSAASSTPAPKKETLHRATHLLESMIDNPIPTRAEVTDVANAIYEGVDSVMLSGETSVGSYPQRCVEQLSNIADRTERFPGLGYEKSLEVDNDKQHVAIHAVALAEAIKAEGLSSSHVGASQQTM